MDAIARTAKGGKMLAYCDHITHLIKTNLNMEGNFKVYHILSDLDYDGALQSTKHFIFVKDKNKKKYKITIEEVI